MTSSDDLDAIIAAVGSGSVATLRKHGPTKAEKVAAPLRGMSTTAALRSRVVQSNEVPVWLARCRDECVLRFDCSRYNLSERIADLLGVRADDLSQLHRLSLEDVRWPVHPMLARAFKRAKLHKSMPAAAVQQNYGDKAMNADERQQQFLRAFRELCETVVAPSCSGAARRVLVQWPPTLRISLPGSPATIGLHSDQVYNNHTAAEVNWWLPRTPVFGSNTLWLESAPGAGDYRPVTLTPGEVLRFNGHECRHYTLANETDASRVSLDWRAVPEELAGGTLLRIGDFGTVEVIEAR